MIVWKMLKIVGATVLGLMVLYVASIVLIGSRQHLVNGYEVVAISAGEYVISDADHGEVIEPGIEKLAVRRQFIVGYRGKTRYQEIIPNSQGYFIVDTQKKTTAIALDREHFVQELRRLEISDDPPEDLLKPPRVIALP